MEKLIQELTTKVGLTEVQAKQSIETVSTFIKERVPKSFRPQIDNLINGETLSDSVKESLMDTAVDVKEKVEDALKDVGSKTSETVDNIKKKVNDMFSKK